MEIERAKAISNVAQTIIDSARVEVQFLEAIGETSQGGFFETQPRLEKTTPRMIGKSS